MSDADESDDDLRLDPRLIRVYEEASRLDQELFDALCPEYVGLSEDVGRYEGDFLIGEGALKAVYKTYDRYSKRWVALARLREERGIEYYDNFIHEARLIAALSHPNIIKVHDVGIEESGRPYFTMDLKGENTLGKVIKEKSRNRRDLLDVFMKVCDAVAYAHAQGVIHLDLKPDNIQCDSFGEVLVCDWGLGKQLDAELSLHSETLMDEETLNGSTLMDKIQGSLGYMAPEQTVLGGTKDTRTDVYSLGCILHAILTGEPPFLGTKNEVLEDTRRSEIVPLREKYPRLGIPRSLSSIVVKALARDPQSRYESVVSLQTDIQKYLDGYSTRAEKTGFVREARLFYRRNRVPVVIVAIAIILLTVGSVLFLQRLNTQRLETIAERARAEVLLSAASQLSANLDRLEEQTESSHAATARKVAVAATRLKNYGIFDNPVATMEQAKALTQIAISLDPDNTVAVRQLFSEYCLDLNYKAALQLPHKARRNHPYRVFALAFSEYDFSTVKRPSANDLVELISQAAQINDTQSAHLERVITYQRALSPRMKGYDKVLEAFIEYLNGLAPEDVSLRYYEKSKALTLNATTGVKIRSFGRGASKRSLLRLLKLDSLKLNIDGTFVLSDLNGLSLQTLDLSGCEELKLKGNVKLELLKTVYIRPGQVTPAHLRALIHSTVDFQVVER
jgi:serine/threonine-protein kinase